MSLVTPYLNHLKAMKNSVDDVIKEILIENKSKIVDLVKKKQLAKGITTNGGAMNWKYGTGYYAKKTQKFATKNNARKRKPVGKPYNFEWSGETFDNMDLKLTPKSYEIFTLKSKMDLFKKLGYDELFGLTEEHNDYVNNKILIPELTKWIEENWWKPA